MKEEEEEGENRRRALMARRGTGVRRKGLALGRAGICLPKERVVLKSPGGVPCDTQKRPTEAWEL